MYATGILRRAAHHVESGQPGPPRLREVPRPTEASDEPLANEHANRPATIDEMVGQGELVAQLRIVVGGARRRGTAVPHILLSGPAGYGKTSLAGVVAHELGGELQVATGMMLKKPSDLVGLLLRLTWGTVLFIDEVHGLQRAVMETLYTALEDNEVPLLLGSGNETQAHIMQLPRWTCVCATTDPGLLTASFRGRFGYQAVLSPYSRDELATIVARAWDSAEVEYGPNEPAEVARGAKGTPRQALHLSDRVLDYGACEGVLGVPDGLAAQALKAFGIDELGLDRVDWRILDALTVRFAGRSVGLDALAQAVGIDSTTLREVHEPALVQRGYMQRTKTGRLALPSAYELRKAPK